MGLTPDILEPVVRAALAEDVGSGDVTTDSVVPADARCRATLELEEPGVVCGVPAVRAVFEALDPGVTVDVLRDEGARIAEAPAAVARIEGPARAVLTGERTALNLFGRLCGIATLTARYVDLVQGTGAEILDTRKTLPGWRVLDKYAVAVGGGTNHRTGLYDALLIKDNPVAAAGGVGAAVKAARAAAPPHLLLQVEVESEEQAAEAIEAGARWLLLDNRSPAELRRLAERFGRQAVLEASGGITLANVREIAETGVQRISIGALTHSAPNADVALEVRARGRG